MLKKTSWKLFIFAPSLLGASLIAFPAFADDTDTIPAYSIDAINETALSGQVTSVSQLSDVQPTDWAFQALQSLVERYGCIAGYPDGTYRGNRAMTRYEFAAGVNACLDRVNELITAGLADKVSRDDLLVLQRLQEQFAAELATLRGRVDALEARTAELEANQFSTTTKLRGEVLFLTPAVFSEDDAFNDQVTFGYRARLNFDTSFTGEDLLRTRFQARDIQNFEGDHVGFAASGNSDSDVELDDLYYTTSIGDLGEIYIAANSLDFDDDFSDSISPLDSSSRGGLSSFTVPAQYDQTFPGSGAGIGASLNLIDDEDLNVSLQAGYIADDASSPEEESGLFNGNYGGMAQLVLNSTWLEAAIMYMNSYAVDGDTFDQGIYDTALGDTPAVANTYGAQVNFKINDTFEIGGGIAYSDVQQIGGAEDFDLWSYQGTIAVNDVFGEGNMLGAVVGVPSYTRDLSSESSDTSLLAEVFYRYYVNDNISITPSFMVNTDPYNNNDNDTTFIGAVRTTFQF